MTEEQKFNISLTADELMRRIMRLQNSEAFKLYLQVGEGMEEYKEYEMLTALAKEKGIIK